MSSQQTPHAEAPRQRYWAADRWGKDNGGGDRALAYIARTGETFAGHAVWTKADDALFVKLYPDYRRLVEAFPRRTLKAIKNHAQRLGVQKRRHVWTNVEVLRLRGLYSRAATNSDLQAAFPGLRLDQIHGKAWHIRLHRKRKPYKVLGVPILDAIRAKTHATGLTLVDLDELARTKRYFRTTTRRVMWKYVARAVALLEGVLEVTWDGGAEEAGLVSQYR